METATGMGSKGKSCLGFVGLVQVSLALFGPFSVGFGPFLAPQTELFRAEVCIIAP